MSRILTADLHLTDRQQDEYRFGLFPWLGKQAKQRSARSIVILGDLTDLKNKHSSILVNRIVDELYSLTETVETIYIIAGNHDYEDPDKPFFDFLNEIPGLYFIKEPTAINGDLFLPHTRDHKLTNWNFDLIKKAKYIFMHQTMDGSLASNGFTLPGLQASTFKRTKAQIYSGDIHVPQKIGKVTYVGSPYAVHFNDTFTPRVLYLHKDGTEEDLYFDTIIRCTLDIESIVEIHENELERGDQVKIRMKLPKEEAVYSSKYRTEILKACEELGLEVFGIELSIKDSKSKRVRLDNGSDEKIKMSRDPKKILFGYCKQNNVSKRLRQVGQELL